MAIEMMAPTSDSHLRNRHAIVLVAHYPPSGESGARRPFNVVRELRKAGWEVDVVVVQPGPVEPELGTHQERVHYARRPLSAAARRTGRYVDQVANRMPWHRDSTSPFWAAVRRTMLPLLRANSVVYVSAPPPSLATFAARLVGSNRGLRSLIMEFRDPWIFKIWSPWRSLVVPFVQRQRMRTLAKADAIIGVTTSSSEAFRELAPDTRHVVAMSGIPDDLLQRSYRPRQGEGPLRILYLGEFYLYRNPRPVLDAVATLIARGQLQTQSVELQFIGDVEHPRGAPLRQLLAERGLTHIAHIQSRVDHDRARQLLEEADIFLLHAERQPRQVPNKLYEYLAYRRPIIAIADADGATARLLRSTGHSATLVPPDAPPERVEAAINEALAAAVSGELIGDSTVLESLLASKQLAAAVELAEEIRLQRQQSMQVESLAS